jgi:hypothetical protein
VGLQRGALCGVKRGEGLVGRREDGEDPRLEHREHLTQTRAAAVGLLAPTPQRRWRGRGGRGEGLRQARFRQSTSRRLRALHHCFSFTHEGKGV